MLNKSIGDAFSGLALNGFKIDAKNLKKNSKSNGSKESVANVQKRSPCKNVLAKFADLMDNSKSLPGIRLGDTDWDRPQWADDELLKAGREAADKYFGA